MPAAQSDLLEKLYAHRAALNRLAEAARLRGDQQSTELNQLLIRQCDWLIERAQQLAAREDQTPWLLWEKTTQEP